MYAKFCSIEILSSYIKEVSMGDLLTVQALVTNPLDWQHFYEKISSIREGERTDFMVVTAEGDRLQGSGDVVEMERWSSRGQWGFRIKIRVKKQKSLTDRRTRAPKPAVKPAIEVTAKPAAVATAPEVSVEDVARFKELLKGSLAMDISA
ncbi:hypothetical protein [Nitrososphaera sp.]|uniref:hypothetical protein n=1 Tax=Nitrososphaera sp. TaxID=1971748 RepID=UPI00185D217E|nr:hypothetical protein [Nitrososphaera sp.]NWG37500.1 hypothetical protein [Nitrososphaera sp.]